MAVQRQSVGMEDNVGMAEPGEQKGWERLSELARRARPVGDR